VKHVLIAAPTGARLYALSDAEFERFEHLLGLQDPAARGAWARRFLGEREPVQLFPPGSRGLPADITVDRAIGGNAFTRKWGRLWDNGRGRGEGPAGLVR
jgi:hypothetical protein